MEPLSTEVAELRKEVLDLRMAVYLLLQVKINREMVTIY